MRCCCSHFLIQATFLFDLGLTKRQRTHRVDVDDVDAESLQYTKNLVTTIPPTYDALRFYLDTTSPSKLTKNTSSPLTGEESFDTFLESVCSDSADSCHSFLCAFEAFACNVHAKEYAGEMEVVPLVDAALLPLQVLLRTKTGRNSKTATTGNKLPDFKMTVGNARTPIFLGEDKTFSSRKDPIHDLETKAPWDNWEDFYGNLPYYFAYTCI